MSHSIKVSDAVFLIIQKYQGPRESYSHCILRAFEGFITLDAIRRGEWSALQQAKVLLDDKEKAS